MGEERLFASGKEVTPVAMYDDKPKDRIILHCDCNNFFASVEETLRPELRDVPMAVAGDPESRHGIIVAKNQKAKAFGVQTAETIWQAKKKCPDLVCVPSHHRLYHEFYEKINAIYLEYTDLVEPFSVDESYLDVTNSIHLFKMTPKELADHLRARIKEELDITISVGVSFCKVFAKLGSDYKKPNATTVIMREDVERIVYPLPVSSLIFVGKRSVEVLEQYHIRTCGDLVQYDQQTLHRILGKSGDTLYEYIHGLESSRVHSWYEKHEPKSIGNSMTFRHDLVGEAELKAGISALCDSVAGRLRHAGKKCRTVQIGIRNPDFVTIQRQTTLDVPTYLKSELVTVSMKLLRDNWDMTKPVRLLSVTGSELVNADEEVVEQLSLFNSSDPSEKKIDREKQEKIESTIDELREKYGKGSITLGFNRLDRE